MAANASSEMEDIQDVSGGEGDASHEGGEGSVRSQTSAGNTNKPEMRSQFSHAKILHIIKSTHDFGGATQDAVFLMARATELFLEKMARDLKATNPNADHFTYDMLAKMAHSRSEYAFLAKQGILPLRMKFSDAIERHRQCQNQRRIIEDPFYGLQIETPLRNQAKYAAEGVRQQNLPQMLKSLYSPPSKVNTSPVQPAGGSGISVGKGMSSKKLEFMGSGSSSKPRSADSAMPVSSGHPAHQVSPMNLTTRPPPPPLGNSDVINIDSDEDDDCMIVP